MKLDVPFRQQESETECGIANLQMATSFLGEEPEAEKIRELLDYSEGQSIYTIQLATLACKLGFEAEFFTKDLWNEHDNEYHEEHAEDIENKELNRNAKDAGVEIQEKKLSLKELTDLLDENSVPIVLLDWNVFKEEDGYLGHFVTVVGYNESEIIVHNSNSENGAFTKIDRSVFDEARESEGTDQDIALIKKKLDFP